MKLHILQSDHGDCMLLEGKDGKLVLVDGGLRSSMKEFGRKELNRLANGRPIEFAYISHIDQDHISGVLQMLEDTLEWRVHNFHAEQDPNLEPPDYPEPPEIKGIWHNGLTDQLGKNSKPVADLIIASGPSLLATGVTELALAGEELLEIATSIKEALEVSNLASADLLDIPINRPPGSDESLLMRVSDDQKPFKVGGMKFTIIGPRDSELKNLRDGWNTWLRENKETVKALRAELARRISEFSAGNLSESPFDLGSWNGIPDFKRVTAPNVASLMFMVEEGAGAEKKQLLLTGDSQQEIIIDGLKTTGFLDKGFCHVDTLKVQHHGSENNVDVDFCKQVTADNYVFCGNGGSTNPDISVIDMIYNSRTGAKKLKSEAPEVDNKFTFWFSTTSDHSPKSSKQHKAFKAVEKRVAELEAKSEGRLKVKWNTKASTTLTI